MESVETVFRLSAWFTGHVQGVGFRYSTLQIAKGYEVTGYVKNLLDGRVELEAEGEESECVAFLSELESELDAYIKKTESRNEKAGRKHTRFSIA